MSMRQPPAPPPAAFISYSSLDITFAKWLHRRLEAYKVPRSLVGRTRGLATLGRRIGRVILDRTDFAAGNLDREIRTALETAVHLIVVCSPNSATSEYVDREIRYFKQFGKRDAIFLAILSGEPHASAKPGYRLGEECFPKAVIYQVDSGGELTTVPEPTEPLAADFRHGKDGRQNGFLKLAAGMLGVGLNELTMRERQAEKQRRRSAYLIAVIAAVMIATGLAFWQSRRQADRAAQEIADAFDQGDDQKREYGALWRLAATGSDQTTREVFMRFLSAPDSVGKFNEHSAEIIESVGLRLRSLNILVSLSLTGPCARPLGQFIRACAVIARASGVAKPLADQFIERLSKAATRDEAARLAEGLGTLTLQLTADQLNASVSRIKALLDDVLDHYADGEVMPYPGAAVEAQSEYIKTLSEALAALVPRLEQSQAGPLANSLLEKLADVSQGLIDERGIFDGSTTKEVAGNLADALTAIVPKLNDVQKSSLVGPVVKMLCNANGAAEAIGRVAMASSTELTSLQAQRLEAYIADADPCQVDEEGLEDVDRVLGKLALRVPPGAPPVNILVDRFSRGHGHNAVRIAEMLAAIAAQLNDGQAVRVTDRIVELLGELSSDDVRTLYGPLATLAPRVRGDNAKRLSSYLMGQLVYAGDRQPDANLGRSLVALAPYVDADRVQAEIDRIIQQVDKSFDKAPLERHLAALAPLMNNDQLQREIDRVLRLLKDAASPNARVGTFASSWLGDEIDLAEALKTYATSMREDQVEYLAGHIVNGLGNALEDEARILSDALVLAVPRIKGSDAGRLAVSILRVLGNGEQDEALKSALVTLAPNIKGQAVRRALLAGFADQASPMPCAALVADATVSDLPLLVDMLKWPVCESRDGIMLRIAELQRADSREFGAFYDPGNRRSFRGDLLRFIFWLKMEKESSGKPFDIDGPPTWYANHKRH